MSLLTQAMEDVVMLEKTRVPDGEGGFTTGWVDGVQFKAAISFDSSMEARTAEKQGMWQDARFLFFHTRSLVL